MPEPLLDIRPDHLQIVRDILQKHVPQYEVWAFGSRAKWTAKEYSDLDLCIVSDKPLSFSVLGAIGEDFSESDLPWKVDVVDWATTSPSFRKIIERNKVILKSRENPSEWSVKPLGEVINLKRGYDLPAQSRSPGNVPVISSSGITDFHSVAKAKAPGVVTGRYGTIGQVFFSEIDYWPLNTTLYVEDFKGNNPRFVYYLLKTISYQTYSDKAAVPGVNRNHLHTASVPIPDLRTQDEIAEALTSFDDKIALLRETNATLEAIAQTLYKSWFVNFDPVRAKAEGREPEGMDSATVALFPDSFEDSKLGELPKGWHSSTIDSVSVVGIGKTPPRKEPQWFSADNGDVRWVSIRDMGISGSFISQTSEYLTAESIEKFNVRLVPDNTVLLSFKMTIGRVAITDGEMTTNEAIAHFKLNEMSPLTSEYIYLHLKLYDYASLSSTSSIADAVNSKTVKAIPILVPHKKVVLAFQELIRPVFKQIKLSQQQMQSLVTLRDTLLPRLMSGKVSLSKNQSSVANPNEFTEVL